jgi:dihydroorotase
MINSVTIPRWFDRHLHVRDGEMLQIVLPCTLKQKATGAVIMGNLQPPDETSTIEKALAYKNRIIAAMPPGSDFVPCMTLYLTDAITPEEVERGFDIGAWDAVKLYLADQNGEGGTTGSHAGVRNLPGRYPVFEIMERRGIPLLGHFEAAEADVDEFDREVVSMERDLLPMVKTFSKMPIVVEHITDGRVADFVATGQHLVNATVTAHHLMINRNAMFQGGMNPGHYCRPVPKREKHRERIRRYVTSGNPHFGAGTDSAPHNEGKKSLCYRCAAGIFTAPKALEMYTTVFDEDGGLENLGPFLSENFLYVYRVAPSTQTMTLVREPEEVPQTVGPVQVFKGGTVLPWKLAA